MCTVTFIPHADKIFIAHSRDEKKIRAKAIKPEIYTVQGHTLLFPRDAAAGGTWIAAGNNGNAAVLLNGALEKHVPLPPYKKSRGLVFLDIVASADMFSSYNNIDLTGIEPFTVILWSSNHLYECRWNGIEKQTTEIDPLVPHTWSSVTLYNQSVISKRETWFNNWLQLHTAPSLDEVAQYHLSTGDGDAANNLRMNRNDELLTVSITVMEIRHHKTIMKYLDLQDNTSSTNEFIFTKATVEQQ